MEVGLFLYFILLCAFLFVDLFFIIFLLVATNVSYILSLHVYQQSYRNAKPVGWT